jgi:hypothetical protein
LTIDWKILLRGTPTVSLDQKRYPFVSSPACQKLFERLKKYFILTQVLCHLDSEKENMAETNASNLIVVVLLSQSDDKGILHPVTYIIQKHLPMENNYEIYEEKLLTIIHLLKDWYPYFEDSLHTNEVTSNP